MTETHLDYYQRLGGHGMTATVLITGLADALKRDGIEIPAKRDWAGPALCKWINEVAAEITGQTA